MEERHDGVQDVVEPGVHDGAGIVSLGHTAATQATAADEGVVFHDIHVSLSASLVYVH